MLDKETGLVYWLDPAVAGHITVPTLQGEAFGHFAGEPSFMLRGQKGNPGWKAVHDGWARLHRRQAIRRAAMSSLLVRLF